MRPEIFSSSISSLPTGGVVALQYMLVSLLHDKKDLAPIDTTLLGIVTVVRLSQYAKVASPIDIIPSGRDIFSRLLQCRKVSSYNTLLT